MAKRGFSIGARGRNRTGTPIRREILSLLCLPISPPGRMEGVHQIAVRILTLTEIISPIFHRNFDIFLDNLKICIRLYYIDHRKQKKAYQKGMLSM